MRIAALLIALLPRSRDGAVLSDNFAPVSPPGDRPAFQARPLDDIVAKLTPHELEQVIQLVGRCPTYYPRRDQA